MRLTSLTASTAALLLSSTALMAQEAQSQSFQSVFIDVGGTAVLVPIDVALEACALDGTTLQTVARTRLDESGIDQNQFFAQMDSARGTAGPGGTAGTGDAAIQDTAATAAASTGPGDVLGTITAGGTAAADAAGTTGAGTTGTAGAAAIDTATADAGATANTGAAGDTTQTANANTTTDAGNTTTNAGNMTTGAGNSTDVASADSSGTVTADTSDLAASTALTDTADASGAAGQDATAVGTGTAGVQNIEATAANTTGDAGAIVAVNADPLLLLAACQIDQGRAAELQVDLTRTGSSLGFDAGALGVVNK